MEEGIDHGFRFSPPVVRHILNKKSEVRSFCVVVVKRKTRSERIGVVWNAIYSRVWVFDPVI